MLPRLRSPFAEKDADGHSQPTFDILFGPAYKGIPLATATMNELGVHNTAASAANVQYSFNRKKTKSHGEGGNIVGAPLMGKRCVITDDVITAGTALREAVDIIEREGGIVAGILVLMARQERVKEDDPEKKSAIQTGEEALGGKVPITPLLRFQDIIDKLGSEIGEEIIDKMQEYKERYGAVQLFANCARGVEYLAKYCPIDMHATINVSFNKTRQISWIYDNFFCEARQCDR